MFKAFLICFILLSSRLFSYIISADGRLVMTLVFFFGSVVFPFGDQVSELKQNYSNYNIHFLLEEMFVFPFEKFL